MNWTTDNSAPKRLCARLIIAVAGIVTTVVAQAAEPNTPEHLHAAPFLVESGRPRAEIVVAKQPQRTTLLAADELQTYIEKISGAKLPIVTEPRGNVPVQVYVGQSPHTERLGITSKGLRFGAYRVVSGDNWLVLIGDDTNFVPIEPWPRSHNDIVSGKMQTAWNAITGNTWGYPLTQLRKHYTGATGLFGTENEQYRDQDGNVNIWGFDERGSFNAVCGFLRKLGVRWYLPGELGEVVPDSPTIPLPKLDKTVRPEFEVRRFNVRFGTASRDTAMWAARLGMRDPYGLRVAHGMHTMTHCDAILNAHPDWFALYGGKRHSQPGQRLNHLCYSNEELFRETVTWARTQFDHFNFSTVSVMPPDAYISICQCRLCEGKDVPEMGSRGKLSNHVWDFVNRVAKETGKTHPGKQIVCCAYGANTNPPTNITKLEPNVQVIIVGGRRPANNLPEQREAIRALRNGWAEKTDNPLMIFENYPFTDRGWYLPAFVANSIGESINATKDISRGEDIWLSFGPNFDRTELGFNHFMVYFTARMYWGGPDQDVAAMLDEYCRLFYGPAAGQMHTFFDYCESNWQRMEKEKQVVDRALAHFDAAKESVEVDSIYAKRLALIDDFLAALRSKSKVLGQKRGRVPKLRTVHDPKEITVDGKLDDAYWKNCPVSSTGSLRELQTGRQPIFGTSIKVGRLRDDVYFAIRCAEHRCEKLNITTERREDQAIWYGDAVEFLIETDSHSYYQIVVNPAGAMVDLDRGAEKHAWFRWESQAELATSISDDHWTIEIRIPVTDDGNDPLNQVVGRKPLQSLPWHINICRQRIRENGSEYSAFSPTGSASFHDRMRFAHFYDGRSYQFEAADLPGNFLFQHQAADALMRSRRFEEAISAWTQLAAREDTTDFQKSDAFEQAALAARSLKRFQQAAKLASQIPITTSAKTARIQNLLAERRFEDVITEFGDETFSQWPFWKIGEVSFARARAFFMIKYGKRTEADLQVALPFTSDSRTRMSILRLMGQNRESVLQDDEAALEAYRKITEAKTNTGSAEFFYGVQGAARILARRGEFDEAMKVLDLAEAEKLSGTWRGSMLLARGHTLAAAKCKDEALVAYRAVMADESASQAHRTAAEDAVKELESRQ
jgi:tetratricopeptide (TPR) repeat protein